MYIPNHHDIAIMMILLLVTAKSGIAVYSVMLPGPSFCSGLVLLQGSRLGMGPGVGIPHFQQEAHGSAGGSSNTPSLQNVWFNCFLASRKTDSFPLLFILYKDINIECCYKWQNWRDSKLDSWHIYKHVHRNATHHSQTPANHELDKWECLTTEMICTAAFGKQTSLDWGLCVHLSDHTKDMYSVKDYWVLMDYRKIVKQKKGWKKSSAHSN